MHSLSRNSHSKLIIFMNCLNKGFKKEIWYLHVLRHSGEVFIQLFHFFNKFHMFLKPLSWKLASAQLPCLDGNLWLNKPWIFDSGFSGTPVWEIVTDSIYLVKRYDYKSLSQTSLLVVVHLWPAVPTDANKTDGMARFKSASSITWRKKTKLGIQKQTNRVWVLLILDYPKNIFFLFLTQQVTYT